MTIELSQEGARRLLLRAQGLTDGRGSVSTVASVVHDRCGVQAQDRGQVPLAIRARSAGVTAADVEAEQVVERSVVRTWCMRGTLHYVTVADLPGLLSLFGPLYVERGRRRLADLGLDDDDCDRAVAVVRAALADDGPLTRDEVAERLLDDGFEFDPDGQAPFHVVRRTCLEGIAIEAAPRDGEETYTLLDDWVSLDPAPDRDGALAELARRYLAAHEPATPDDFYAWSGLYKRDVRAGWDAIEDELTEVDVAGERAWIVSNLDDIEPADVEPDDTPIVRLLPMYDGYFLGHRDRDLVLPDDVADHVYPGGGVIRAAVIADGLPVATWKLDRSRATPAVLVEPFDGLDPAVESELEAEVEDIGRFLDVGLEFRMQV